MTGERVPQRLGKYELIEEAGRGGFSVVYKARDTSLDRIVALKVLAPHLTWDPSFAERFRREARAAAGLRHSNIVTIYEAGEENGQLYIAMEFLERTLAQVIAEQGALPLERATAILAQVADALDYAHSEGVVHRDVKSSNIMVEEGRAGQVRATLMDFGLVKALESSEGLTSMGTVLGSPEYMAPEQADPERATDIGPATDRYALGVVAYEMLAGRVPFRGSTSATLHSQIYERPPDPSSFRGDLIAGVSPVLLKALSKAPQGRYPTASAMVEALRRAEIPVRPIEPIAEPTPSSSPKPKSRPRPRLPVWVWAAIGILVPTLIIGGMWLRQRPPSLPLPTPTPTYTPLAETSTATDAPTPTLPAGAIRWDKDDSVMVHIPPSIAQIGGEKKFYVDVFWIDRAEVTNGQYARCVEAQACVPPSRNVSNTRDAYYGNPDFNQYPVIYVNWSQADAYCRWAGKRLPTIEEWERAARGDDGREYPWGDWMEGHANTEETGVGDTTPVGHYSPLGDSPYGCADMAGNVWEWTSGRNVLDKLVVRGGSWSVDKRFARCAVQRRIEAAHYSANSLGFRCVSSTARPES